MGRWSVLVGALLLAGCSSVAAPSSGLTDAELADYYQAQLDLSWKRTELPDDLRPPAPPIRVISGDVWGEMVATCMNDAGFDNYSGQGGGLAIEYVSRPTDEAQAEIVWRYTCESGLHVEGQDDQLLNPAEVDYLYSYYRDVLVPCLETNGVTLETVPTQTQFVETNGGWNPYFSVAEASLVRLADSSLFTLCPAMPAGMPNANITDESFDWISG